MKQKLLIKKNSMKKSYKIKKNSINMIIKSSIIIIKNVLKCLSDNENGKFPEFSGDILVKQKIF